MAADYSFATFGQKTQKTPQQELEVALERKRKLEGKS